MTATNQLGALKDAAALEAARKIEVVFAVVESNHAKRIASVKVIILQTINHVLREVSES